MFTICTDDDVKVQVILCTTVAFMNNERMDESDVSASVANQADYIPYWDVFRLCGSTR